MPNITNPNLMGPSLAPELKGAATAATATYTKASGNIPIVNQFVDEIQTFSLGGIPSADSVLLSYIMYFIQGMYQVQIYIEIIALAIGLIGVVWHAIKLWTSTEEVKKAISDILLKFILFAFLYTAYPIISIGAINFANALGGAICGGQTLLSQTFSALKNSIAEEIQEAYSGYDSMVADIKPDIKLSEAQMKNLAAAAGWDKKDWREWAADAGIDVDKALAEGWEVFNTDKSDYQAMMAQLQNKNFIYGADGLNWQVISDTKGLREGVDYVRSGGIVYKVPENRKQYKNLVAKYNAICAVFNKAEIDGRFVRGQTLGLDDWFISLYMQNDKGSTIGGGYLPQFLSASQMLKTGNLIAELFRYRGTTDYDVATQEKKMKLFSIDWASVLDFIYYLIILLILSIISIVIAAEYIITILEYSFVATVSYLFVPMLLFEGTKNYTVKLVTTITSYMMKIIVQIAMLMAVYNQFLMLGIEMNSDTADVASGSWLIKIMFTGVLGYWLIKKTPELSQAIMSGQPALNLQTARNDVRHGLQTAHHAGHVAKTAGKVAGGAAKIGGKAIQHVGGNLAKAGAMFQGAKEAAKGGAENAKELGMDKKGQRTAALKTAGGFLAHQAGASFKEGGRKAVAALTGTKYTDRRGEERKEDGSIKDNQTTFAKAGKQAAQDLNKAGAGGGNDKTQGSDMQSQINSPRATGKDGTYTVGDMRQNAKNAGKNYAASLKGQNTAINVGVNQEKKQQKKSEYATGNKNRTRGK